MEVSSSNIYQAVSQRIEELRRKWKQVKGGSYLLSGVGFCFLGFIIASLVETLIWMPLLPKVIILIGILVISANFTVRGIYYLIAIYTQKNHPEQVLIAQWVGDHLPEISDRLRNALQLLQDKTAGKEGYSVALKQAALMEIAPEFLKADVSQVISTRPLVLSLRFFVICALTVLLLLFPSIRSGVFRLLHPFTDFPKPLPFALVVQPGNVVAVEGDTLYLIAMAQGGSPAEITFHIRREYILTGTGEERIVLREKDATYRLRLPAVMKSFKYYASAGRVKSPIYEVEVKSPPMVRKLRIKLAPPAYTGFPPLKLEDNVGDFLVLAGTEAEFAVETRGDIAQAYIAWQNEEKRRDTLKLDVRGNLAKGSKKIFNAVSYEIRLCDIEGLLNRQPILYRVEILPDLPPTVEIVQPGADLELSGTGNLPILIEAEDDFGLSRMDLDYRLTSQFSADTSGEYTETPLDFIQDVDGVFRASFLWDIGALNIIPGDIVEYFAVVADNDNINGPKIAQSKIYTLRLLSMEEMYQAMEQSENEGFEQLEKALENSREMKEEIEHAINEMRRKGDLDWTQKRDLQEKAKFNEETIKKLEEAKSKLEEVMSQAEESSLMSLELLQKYSELQKLISEIATPEMLKAFQQLNDALQQADPEKLRQAMEMFQMSQEEMLKKIEKSLEILKQLQLERKLEELAQRAAEMAQRQDDINQKIPDEEQVESPELARKEASLEKDLDEWEQKLEESEKLAAERDSSTANELSQIQEQAQSLPQEMEQMSSMMKSGQNEASRSKGGRISQKLTQISQELSRIKEEMISRKKAELSEKMLSAVRDLVTISQQQEELKSASSNLSTRSPQFRDQASLQAGIAEGLEKVTNKLFELSQQTFFVTPEIGKSLGQASAIMQTALSNYTERNPRGVTPQQMKAMESINQAAVQVLDAISQMQGSASSTGFSELMEKLQQMAGQQASLNQDTQSLMMPMPGEGGMSMEQMAAMGRLAAQQRALQKAMQEAAEQAQQLGKVLGDLGQAAQNMGEVADSLEDRNVGERTLKLQERILSRLLDAQKSVRTQKVSRERQSRTGEDISRRSPGEIPLDQLEEQMRRDILRAMKEGYSPDYQKLIQDYFRTIYQRKKND